MTMGNPIIYEYFATLTICKDSCPTDHFTCHDSNDNYDNFTEKVVIVDRCQNGMKDERFHIQYLEGFYIYIWAIWHLSKHLDQLSCTLFSVCEPHCFKRGRCSTKAAYLSNSRYLHISFLCHDDTFSSVVCHTGQIETIYTSMTHSPVFIMILSLVSHSSMWSNTQISLSRTPGKNQGLLVPLANILEYSDLQSSSAFRKVDQLALISILWDNRGNLWE